MSDTAKKKVSFTKKGYERLKEEYKRLTKVERVEVLEELKNALSEGDLSENADFDAAVEHQGEVESRIKELAKIFKNKATILKDNKKTTQKYVRVGSKVDVMNTSSKTKKTFWILGDFEINPLKNIISAQSPIARVLLNKKVKDRVIVQQVDEPYELQILKIY